MLGVGSIRSIGKTHCVFYAVASKLKLNLIKQFHLSIIKKNKIFKNNLTN